VVFFLAIFLLLVELGIRQIEPRLSRDLAHIRHLPEVAASLRNHQGTKVLVMGNSLTRKAIEPTMLATGLESHGRASPKLFFFTPDGTSIINWDYGLRRYFLHADAKPDEIYIGTGPLHLHDHRDEASRLAAYYVDRTDLPRVWHEDLPGWEQRCEFILSRLSVLHASRARIKPHVFGTLIPHYFDVEQAINNQRAVAMQRTGQLKDSTPTYDHLATLLATCREAGIRVTLFSIPLPGSYQDPMEAVKLIRSNQARWLSLAPTPGFTASHFPDGYHLNDEGARLFTTALLNALDQP